MEIDTKILGIDAKVIENILFIRSTSPMKILSSAVFNGGLKEATGILNIQVPEGLGSDKNDVHWSPESFVLEQIEKFQLPKEKTIGLMTAAKMKNVSVCSDKFDKTTLTIFVTAGATVAVTAGEPTASKTEEKMPKIGTINIILLVDGKLTESCMVDAVKTITEAKTVALRELDIRSQLSGDIATGTLTDSVAVGCTNKGEEIQYAGTFTMLGELIGKCVRQAVKSAMYKQEKLLSNRPLLERLSERGISPQSILSMKSEPKSNCENATTKELEKYLKQILSDKKIALLIIACLRLDEDFRKGLIPTNASNEIDRNKFEEIIQTTLSNFLSINNTNSFDTTKEQTLQQSNVGPFTKCALLAVLERGNQK